MSNVRCGQCNLVNFATASSCRRCGADVTAAASRQQPPDYYAQGAGAEPAMPYDPPPMWQEPYSAPPPHYQTPYQAGYQTPYHTPNQGPYYGAPPKLKQGLAITSLVIGCVGLVICVLGIVGAIPGLICGIVAVKKANQNPAEYGGKGMAIAGIVTNGLALMMIPVVMAIAIPNLLASRKAANEAAAIRRLRELASAEATYQATTGLGKDFGTWEELARVRLLTIDKRSVTGYNFKIVVVNCQDSGRYSNCAPHFEVHATPIAYGPMGTGTRSFYTDETYVIFAGDHAGNEAGKRDGPIR